MELQYQVNRNSIENHNNHNSLSTPFKRNSSRKVKSEEAAQEALEQQSQIMQHNFNELIDDLKSSLEVTNNHNNELKELVEQTLNKNAELQKANNEAKEQNALAEKDLEKLNKAFLETKDLIDSFKSSIANLEGDLAEVREDKKQLEEKLFMAEEQIINLISINEGHLKTKKDNLEVIESLKNTIEIIKRGGYSDEENIVETKIKLEEMENTINQKNYTIKTMSDSINNFEKDREFFNLTLNNLKDETSDKDKFIEELEDKFRLIYADFEKANMRAETLQVKLDESEQTISNLKTSINFINETMEEYKADYDKIRAELENERSEKNKLAKNIETTKEKFSDLTLEIEDLQENKDSLQKKVVDIDKELKEKKNLLKKTNFEKNNMEQQLQEAKTVIDTLKDEIKADKFAKLNEEFQNEIFKSNEERMKKIDELRMQIESKTKEIESNNEMYSENIRAKDDKIKELMRSLSKAESINEQNEKNFNEKVYSLSNTIEQLKSEIQQTKFSFESEKRNAQYQLDDYQRQIKDLQLRLQTSENNYSNLLKKNFENYQNAAGSTTNTYANKADIDYVVKSNNYDTLTNKHYNSGANNVFQSSYQPASSNGTQMWSGLVNNAITATNENDINKNFSSKYYSNSTGYNIKDIDYATTSYKGNIQSEFTNDYNLPVNAHFVSSTNNAQTTTNNKNTSNAGNNYY